MDITKTPIAHRGLHTLPHAPENSLAAFESAVQARYPIEIDVRLLTDGTVAIFHDSDLSRLTGATGKVEARTASDLRDLRLLGTDEHVPTFKEALDLVAGRVPFLVELKHDAGNAPGALEAAVVAALEGYTGEFAIQSFHVPAVAWFAQNAPHITRGQLASNDNWTDDPNRDTAPHFLAYNLAFLPTPHTTAWQKEGRALIAWTIQTPEQQTRARELADNIIFEHVHPSLSKL